MATRVPPSTTPLAAEDKPKMSDDLAKPADYKKVLKVRRPFHSGSNDLLSRVLLG